MFVLFAFAAAAAAALIEARRRAYRDRDEWRRELRISLVLGAAAAAIDALVPGARPDLTGGETVALALVVFVADDLLYYVSHRLAHRVSLFWASHAVHHSPVRYDFFTGLRQPPTWLLTPAAVAPLVLLGLGAPPVLVALSAGVRALHHFAIHTERVRRLPGWIEFVFNTPSHHRVHHSSKPEHLDRNFGGVLIVWDRLFGTFCAEREGEARAYGLAHAAPAGAWLVFTRPWRDLARRMRRSGGVVDALRVMLSPPAKAAPVQVSPSGLTTA